jgi:hypothetical protein
MWNCCGEDRETPFCPLCGSRGPEGETIDTLIAYLDHKRLLAEKCVEHSEHVAKVAPIGEKRTRFEKKIPRHKEDAAKFAAWIQLLRESK